MPICDLCQHIYHFLVLPDAISWRIEDEADYVPRASDDVIAEHQTEEEWTRCSIGLHSASRQD